jgi:phage N-6-adenine-methyltransferase
MDGKNTACFSKQSDEWTTPDWLYNRLDEEFLFELDAAADAKNTKSCGFYGKDDDALVQPWYEDYGEDGCVKSVFLNPPYSQIGAFMKKAYEESLEGAVVVCLIPARTDTKYWHEYVMKAQEIRFVKGRLKFSNQKNSAPFPSVVVIFDPHYTNPTFNYPRIGKTIEQPI